MKSETIPNQAMSLRELLQRFVRGQAVPPARQGGYEEEDFSDFDKLDKFEKMEMAINVRQEIRAMQEEMQNPAPKGEGASATKEAGNNPPASGDKSGDKAGDKPAGTA